MSLICRKCGLYFIYLQLNEALQQSQQEVAQLSMERENFEENMKKAFMRGVCALNMEAMTMFGDQEARGRSSWLLIIEQDI